MLPAQANTSIRGIRRYWPAIALAAAVSFMTFSHGNAKPPNSQQPWSGPVPRANCAPGDRTETGLQGEVTSEDVTSGRVNDGFNCNLDLVGTYEGEGASFGFTWFKDCAYMGTGGGMGAPSPLQQHPGVTVLDASDPTRPQATQYLSDNAMLEPWESLRVNTKRKLLGATRGLGLDAVTDRWFAFYDISNCANPILLSSVSFPDHVGHEGRFTADGLTYFGTRSVAGGVTALDISDPRNPKELLHTNNYLVHGLALNKEGTRAYFAQLGSPNSPTAPTANGLVIVDVSDIQARLSNPQIRTISTLFWNDGATAQVPLPVTIAGKPYLIFTDEHGSGGSSPKTNAGQQRACSLGLPPNGFPRIIDISDESNPKTVAKLMLEIDDPANCPIILNDPPHIISASSHYCGVDKLDNPKMVACTFREAGLRVFDIHDLSHPREIAYYKPRARRTEVRPGSVYWGPQYANGGDRIDDQTPTDVRFKKYKGELQLWFTSEDNGFQILKFSDHFKKVEPGMADAGDDNDD